MDKVSVIIPTFNRFKYLLNAIKSVKNQTYKNVEIIVVNDCSTEKEYYEHNFGDVKIIHLEVNSKKKFGFACPGGYQRNCGFKIASGKYIAFLDDDDMWFPNKLEIQINAMNETGCKMSCTDGLIGNGIHNNKNKYNKYNAEHYYDTLKKIYKKCGSNLLNNGFPRTWNLDFLKIHNCCICSSVVIEKIIIDKVGNFIIGNYADDYEYWLRVLQYTDCVYCNDICFYYDNGHGDGQNYK